MSKKNFTPDSLVQAVTALFESNNYEVEGPLRINGAEIDLKAISKTDPFAPPNYIEVTTEYVDNEKYGKDATKFLLLRETEPNSTLICVTSSGFSLPVKERAKSSRVFTLTYDELFSKFQRFDEYVSNLTKETDVALELKKLDEIYEEPQFNDSFGNHFATDFLSR